jgi:hypothetical protein
MFAIEHLIPAPANSDAARGGQDDRIGEHNELLNERLIAQGRRWQNRSGVGVSPC